MAAATIPVERASQILEDQIIHVKRGRLQGFGFEPAWNAYFDFYLSPKYIDPPLLQLEDVTFHLFLRKNLNDRNPEWKMPSIRQMKRRLNASQGRLQAMMNRLDQAKLLEKVSGYRQGEEGENIPNHYILSDPVQTLDEFLVLASSGVFGTPLKEEWRAYLDDLDPCTENRYTLYQIPVHPPVPEIGTYKQTSSNKQGGSSLDKLWSAVLETLKLQLPSATFFAFIADTHLLALDQITATVELANPSAKDWVEQRLSRQLKQLLFIEGKMLNPEMQPLKELVVVLKEKDQLPMPELNTPCLVGETDDCDELSVQTALGIQQRDEEQT